MEYFRRLSPAVKPTIAFAALLAVLLSARCIWGNLPGEVIASGGVASSPVTQLDSVTALQDQLLEGAEVVYSSAHTESFTLCLDSVTDVEIIAEDDLYETDLVLTWTAVYAQADTSGTVVCTLLPGTVLTNPAQEDGQSWYEVYYNGLCGYVPAAALERNTTETDASAQLTYTDLYGIALTELTLYASPSAESDALITLASGECVQLLSSEDGWYYVCYKGSNGYLTTDLVLQSTEKPTWLQEEERAAALATLRSNIVATAKSYLGCSYAWSAAGPSSFDCSGFTMYILGEYGVSLSHSAAGQFSECSTSVSKDELQPGDLVFFSSNGLWATHVGIYIGNGQFIHASSSQRQVIINNLTDTWYASAYFGARSVLN